MDLGYKVTLTHPDIKPIEMLLVNDPNKNSFTLEGKDRPVVVFENVQLVIGTIDKEQYFNTLPITIEEKDVIIKGLGYLIKNAPLKEGTTEILNGILERLRTGVINGR